MQSEHLRLYIPCSASLTYWCDMDNQVQGEGTITKPAKNAAKCQRTSVVMQLVVHNKTIKS